MGAPEGHESKKGASTPPSLKTNVMVNIVLNRVLVLADAVDLDPTLDFAAGTIAGEFVFMMSEPVPVTHAARC